MAMLTSWKYRWLMTKMDASCNEISAAIAQCFETLSCFVCVTSFCDYVNV